MEIKRNAHFFDAVFYEGSMFFSSSDLNALCMLSEGNKSAFFLDNFINESLFEQRLHRKTIKVENKIYCIPYMAKEISIYNIKENDLTVIDRGEKLTFGFSNAFLIGRDIVLIPIQCKNPLLILHTEDDSIEELCNPYLIIQNKIGNDSKKIKDSYFDVYGSELVDDTLFLVVYGTTIVIRLNVFKRISKIYHLKSNHLFRNLSYDNGMLYFVSSNQYILTAWNMVTNELKEFDLPKRENVNIHPFMTCIRFLDHLFLIPDKESIILEFDKTKEMWIQNINMLPERFKREKNKSLFLGYMISDERLFLFPRSANGMIVYDGKYAYLKEISYSIQDEEKFKMMGSEIIKKQLDEEKLINEDLSAYTDLYQLLEFINM